MSIKSLGYVDKIFNFNTFAAAVLDIRVRLELMPSGYNSEQNLRHLRQVLDNDHPHKCRAAKRAQSTAPTGRQATCLRVLHGKGVPQLNHKVYLTKFTPISSTPARMLCFGGNTMKSVSHDLRIWPMTTWPYKQHPCPPNSFSHLSATRSPRSVHDFHP
ncbi:hypothetical protein PsorP6_010804 [Peronosclerospora sorghi]|uniref:Uncharacterized protein n=1 Tax=Peronosclerospora sorghi TaxID=230839 RepID=A0ACC0VUX0_9STRA|nr:hypothetical protein PsorP6_010804 [Peronosclerospora sorghi]